jgi:pimeloyl-ACP methyl ester carboxylesterase
MEEMWKNHPFRTDRDIVLMDQRGTGESEALCSNMGAELFEILRQDLNYEAEYAATKSLFSDCKEILKSKKVDLAGYSSTENATDFEELRKVLGYDKWNLLGASYGSRLGLTIMRDFPNSIRSAVFTGILAPESNYIEDFIPNFENALFAVLEKCEEDEDCNSRYPNLKNRLLKTLKNLESDPMCLEYKEKLLILNVQDAQFLVHQALYSRYSITNIPLMIEALENRASASIIDALRRVEFIYGLVNVPMNYSVTAYEELPFTHEDNLKKTLRNSETGFNMAVLGTGVELLSEWHPFRASDIENQAVISEIPTLLASGNLDPVTPVQYATETLKHLKNGYHLIFANDSHDLSNPCFFETTSYFFNYPLEKPNMNCALETNAIEWN